MGSVSTANQVIISRLISLTNQIGPEDLWIVNLVWQARTESKSMI